MLRINKQSKNTVPVGKTPVPMYASWDEHREAMHQDVEARLAAIGRRRFSVTK
jgi:hypothetical protein